jgi:hypothetical protein
MDVLTLKKGHDMKWLKTFGNFIKKQVTDFIHWISLLFADDDAHLANPNAPTIKNFILFILLAIFCITELKVVYLMEVVVHTQVHQSTTVQFKSVDPTPTAPVSTDAVQNNNITFSIPDIPSGWQTVFLAGLGIMATMSGAKHIAMLKYGAGDMSSASRSSSSSTTDGVTTTSDQSASSSQSGGPPKE